MNQHNIYVSNIIASRELTVEGGGEVEVRILPEEHQHIRFKGYK